MTISISDDPSCASCISASPALSRFCASEWYYAYRSPPSHQPAKNTIASLSHSSSIRVSSSAYLPRGIILCTISSHPLLIGPGRGWSRCDNCIITDLLRTPPLLSSPLQYQPPKRNHYNSMEECPVSNVLYCWRFAFLSFLPSLSRKRLVRKDGFIYQPILLAATKSHYRKLHQVAGKTFCRIELVNFFPPGKRFF